jgi:hypothetical protein
VVFGHVSPLSLDVNPPADLPAERSAGDLSDRVGSIAGRRGNAAGSLDPLSASAAASLSVTMSPRATQYGQIAPYGSGSGRLKVA